LALLTRETGKWKFPNASKPPKAKSAKSFTALVRRQGHIALAEKLLVEPPRNGLTGVMLDKKWNNRNAHLRVLHRLVAQVRKIDRRWMRNSHRVAERVITSPNRIAHCGVQRLDRKLQRVYPGFCCKQKVIEEMALVAENIHDKCVQPARAGRRRGATRNPAPAHLVEAERKNQGARGICPDAACGLPRNFDRLREFSTRALQAKTEMVEANLRLVISIAKNTRTVACRSST